MALPNDFTLAAAVDTSVNTASETTVVSYTGDGTAKMSYWTGTGTYAGLWKCYIGTDLHSSFMTNDTERTAYVAFPSVAVPNGTVVYIKVLHEAGSAQTFTGTIGKGT